MFRRCRRCCYMNNCNNISNDMLETKCNNVQNCCYCSKNSCDCGFDEEDTGFPTNPMYGQSYVPVQQMEDIFTPCVGLKMGTIFPELVSPYRPGQSMEEIQFIEDMNKIGEGCNTCH
mgnify:FL=1